MNKGVHHRNASGHNIRGHFIWWHLF